ncbi:MAG TPA: penicillin-binding protein 2 [Polyangiales bacterium]
MNLLRVSREVGEFRKRYKWMAFGVSLAFTVLLVRIVYLQVFSYEQLSATAHENILKTLNLPATRGILRDTTGRVVAQNHPAYRMFVTPSRLRGPEDLAALYDLLSLDAHKRAEFEAQLTKVPESRRTHQIQVLGELTREQLAALETHARELPAVDVLSVPVRDYPYGKLAAHAIGYLNEISAEELAANADQGYRPGDTVGRSGTERAWEAYLRGRRGYRRVYVDARGRRSRIRPAQDVQKMLEEPVPGRDLTLTLDMELMRMLERSFRGQPSGSAVVVDVRTGKVRALFSKPAYDLNEMSGKLSVERATELNESPFRPLIDKTLYDTYFPGSTFKPISALAALGDGIIDDKHTVECHGFYQLGNRRFRCEHVHKEVVMRDALTQSCNIFFYKLAELVGMDRLARFASALGLGEKTGIGINTEAKGFIPTKSWYDQRGETFRVGYTLNAAIGQGNTRVTLMQLAMTYAAIANGGNVYVPQLVESVNAPDGTVLEQFEPRVRRSLHYKPEHIHLVHQALWGVVNEMKGTAYDARNPTGVQVAGKTGTAQVERHLRDKKDEKRSWYVNRAHAWFAGWAPAEAPELAIVVMVEHGGGGGKNAAPIAIETLSQYFSGRMSNTALTSRGAP